MNISMSNCGGVMQGITQLLHKSVLLPRHLSGQANLFTRQNSLLY